MKKLFALILAITVMATLSVTAFATDYDTTGDKGMTVTYSVAPAYTVTIPPTITIGTSGTSAEISAADVVVEKGQYVSVTLAENNNFTVTSGEGATLTYTVTKDSQPVAAGGEVLAVNPTDGKTGTATITFDIDESAIQYAGTYTGSATFTIAVKDVPMISFTIYNPVGDSTTEYSAEKGMTWGDWLESTYNNAGFAVRSDGGITYITIGSSYAGVALELSYLVEDFVKSTDVIQEDYEYVWMQIGG